ncbi:MAG: hypothetical protein ACTS45_01265 [Candidatus Hodgkinia cicadicola]
MMVSLGKNGRTPSFGGGYQRNSEGRGRNFNQFGGKRLRTKA